MWSIGKVLERTQDEVLRWDGKDNQIEKLQILKLDKNTPIYLLENNRRDGLI